MNKENKNEVKYNIKSNSKNNLKVNKTQSVYLTKDKNIMEKLAIEEEMERRFGCDNLQKVIEESDRYIESDDARYLTHDEVFSNLCRSINERKSEDYIDEETIKHLKKSEEDIEKGRTMNAKIVIQELKNKFC